MLQKLGTKNLPLHDLVYFALTADHPAAVVRLLHEQAVGVRATVAAIFSPDLPESISAIFADAKAQKFHHFECFATFLGLAQSGRARQLE
jgi:hypothetical protein